MMKDNANKMRDLDAEVQIIANRIAHEAYFKEPERIFEFCKTLKFVVVDNLVLESAICPLKSENEKRIFLISRASRAKVVGLIRLDFGAVRTTYRSQVIIEEPFASAIFKVFLEEYRTREVLKKKS